MNTPITEFDITELQKLPTPGPELSEAQGCCGLASLVTCPARTFDF